MGIKETMEQRLGHQPATRAQIQTVLDTARWVSPSTEELIRLAKNAVAVAEVYEEYQELVARRGVCGVGEKRNRR